MTVANQPPAGIAVPDAGLLAVANELLRLDPDGTSIAHVIRATFDQLYDGENTGHFRPSELRKTEKTHCGTVLEINLQRRFDLADGIEMDYCIKGIDVDCKFSLTATWMLPRESVGHVCLLVTADDEKSRWSAGLVRVSEEILNPGKNLDSKRTLNRTGRHAIHWLFRNEALPENILLHMSTEDLGAIFANRGGAQRVAELFRRAEGRIVGRGVVRTVGRQLDYMKRIRINGGARDYLTPQGYLVLAGHIVEHRQVAQHLGLPVPAGGEFVSTRITPATDGGVGTVIDANGKAWRRASTTDTATPADFAFSSKDTA